MPVRRVHQQRQRFVGGFHLAGVFVGVHAVRELHPKNFNAVFLKTLRVPLRRPLAGVVRIIGDTHALHLLQRLP